VSTPADLIGRQSSAWKHKNWRVREELLRTVAHAFAELADRGDVNLSVKGILPQVIAGLEDREASVREAAVNALVAMAPAAGNDLHGMMARHTIRPGQLKEIQASPWVLGAVV
jgi:CLIP-associating protein 1/2